MNCEDGPDHTTVDDLLRHRELRLAHTEFVQRGVPEGPGDDGQGVGLDVAGERDLAVLGHTEQHAGGGDDWAAGQGGEREEADEATAESLRSVAGELGEGGQGRVLQPESEGAGPTVTGPGVALQPQLVDDGEDVLHPLHPAHQVVAQVEPLQSPEAGESSRVEMFDL